MNIYIYENHQAANLNPLARTRPVFDLRTGPFTFLERIIPLIHSEKVCLLVRPELEALCREKHPGLTVNPSELSEGIWLLGNVLWKQEEVEQILRNGSAVYRQDETIVGANLSEEAATQWLEAGGPVKGAAPSNLPERNLETAHYRYLWEILEAMPAIIQSDSKRFNGGATETVQGVHLVNPESILLGEDVTLSPGAVLDATHGPVIVDHHVKIESLAYLEGPVFIGNGSVIKPMTHVSESAVGPFTKLGGEVAHVIFQGFSNKVHYGYLGDSFVGEWVNLGAGTTTSNLKNNYHPVVVQVGDRAVNTGSLHVGSFIGDHVKTAIGTVLNTGSVLGPGCMIATPGFPPKTLRPFTWFIHGKHHVFNWEKFRDTAKVVMERRGKFMTEVEKQVLKDIFNKR
jgi:UDP-N-acetylglucosamine diphosphorylase/glucosamine-1-phosphate N-acetyltransferase